MTEQKITMTMEQVEQEMEEYRRIFDVVRLIEEETIQMMEEGREEEVDPEKVACYSFWKKNRQCKNCISARVLREKNQGTKLEFVGEDIYQVTACYMEIDGKAYVMELVKKLNEEFLLDAEGCEKLVRKLDGYNQDLYIDALTGSYNRRYYEERLKGKETSAGVAVIDLDDFKLWNDTYGHGAGDVVLQTVVKAIRQSTRKTDSLVRYGGDEFLLVMPDVSDEVFLKKLEYIQKQIRDADIPGFSRMRLSVSIGGVTVREEVMEEAVRKADRLMYQAKIQKNMVVTERKSIDADGMIHLEEEIKRTKQLIMIVDDSEINREILASILEEDYQIIEAENGEDCLRLLQKYGTEISLILLDIVMPGMNGFQVLHDMNKNHWIEDVPVIMISSEDSEKSIRRAYEMGVSDYISRPFDGKVVYQRVFNTIKLYAKQRRLITLVTDQVYEKEKNNRIMVSILSQIVEFRNGESGLHVEHINKLSGMLLERLVQKTDKYHLTWTDQYLITVASALHDIGNMMAWRIAYCKVFYPLAYYAAYFSIRATGFSYELMCQGKDRLENYMKDYKKRKDTLSNKEQDVFKDMRIVQEMYARGFDFMPLDIYRAHPNRFQIIDGKLMPAINSIDGLGDNAAIYISEAAKDGPFLSKDDFRERTHVSRTAVDLMSDLGLLGSLPESNQLSLFDFGA